MKDKPTLNFDLTYITLVLALISIYINNKVLNISMICLLVGIIITGNILVFSQEDVLKKYYNQDKRALYMTSILTHIIIPFYLIYVISKNTKFKINTKELLIIFIITNTVFYSYYMLMRMGHFGGYNLPPGVLIKYGISIVFITLTILLFIIV